jgi:Glyoxalase-like domain
MSDGEPVGWIREIVLNCPEPLALAEFWSRLLGGDPVEWYPGWVTLEPPPRGQRLSFQASDGPRSEDAGVHFDVLVDDLVAAHERVVGLGAGYIGQRWSPKADDGGAQVPWRVYADPAGHPFCLVVR